MYLKIVMFFLLGACTLEKEEKEQNAAESLDSVPAFASVKSQVKRKKPSQINRSLSKILNLNTNQLCLELGQIPCADIAHKSSLGGMEAYSSSQYEFPKRMTATAPMTTDRVVLSACSTRASLDIVNVR